MRSACIVLSSVICPAWQYFSTLSHKRRRSQGPCGLRRRSTAARLLRLWVRIPPGAWMFVCWVCCVLSGWGLCDGLIARLEDSYIMWHVVVCDQETSNEEAKARYRAVENTRVGTLIVATIYLQLIQNRYKFRSFTALHCSHQHCVQPVASDVDVVGYL